MTIFGYDLTSEQIKVLKVFYKYKVIRFLDIDQFIDKQTLNRTLDFLRSNEFLDDNFFYDKNDKYHPDTESDKIFITIKGENAYLLSRDAKKEYYKKLLLSKWCDIVVSLVISLLTTLISLRLFQ